jgi:heme-degrading monooxygenase HmoA
MVVSVFRSRLRPEHEAEFQLLADELMKTAEAMPGFGSYTLFTSPDGERCSIVEFESLETLEAWRRLPEHLAAKARHRHFYQAYSLQVTEVLRTARFEQDPAEA